MRITRGNEKTGKTTLSITRREWMRIGQSAGWEVPDELPEEDSGSEPEANPMPDIQVTKYGASRFFAVYIDGELLCVTVYKKGAMEVQHLLRQLWGMVQDKYA